MGISYLDLGEYDKVIKYNSQSLKIARQLKDRLLEAGFLLNLGTAYFFLKKYPQALAYSHQSANIAKSINNPRIEGIAFNNIGSLLFKQCKLSEAEKSYRRAIAIRESLRVGLYSYVIKVALFETQLKSYSLLQHYNKY